jgi:hypothetical protein
VKFDDVGVDRIDNPGGDQLTGKLAVLLRRKVGKAVRQINGAISNVVFNEIE